MSDENGSNSFVWFLTGLGLGALLGVLYAPKSGRETREDLMRHAEEGREYVTRTSRDARENLNKAVDRGREVYTKQKEQINAAIEAGKQAFREATEGPAAGSKS